MFKTTFNRLVSRFCSILKGQFAPLEFSNLLDQIMKDTRKVIWVDNLDKTQSIVNLGDFKTMYDRSPEGLSHDPLDWMNAIHPDDVDIVRNALPAQLTGNFDMKYRVVHQDGTQLWLRDRSLLIKDDKGEPSFRAGLVEDISDYVELEDQLRHNEKLKVVGTLAGGIAHDFNNILAIIHGNLELALLSNPSPEVAKFIDVALRASKRGANTTHRLTAFARQQPLSPTGIDVPSLLEEMRAFLESSLGENVDFKIILDDTVWICLADKRELETVLLNLVINARDALGDNGKVIIEARNTELDDVYASKHQEVVPGKYVCFSVSDNGSGMNTDVVKQAFEPFFSTKKSGEGTGLGLSMAHGFAKQSNGHIKIYSEEGAGTTINLYLPITDMPDASSASYRHFNQDFQGLTCIVVDDDLEVGETVAGFLKSLGFHTELFTSPEELIDEIDLCGTADILLTDVVLRGNMNGPQLAQHIHGTFPNLPTIYMSGYTENAIVHHGRLDDGVYLLQKPFSREELTVICSRVLNTSEVDKRIT